MLAGVAYFFMTCTLTFCMSTFWLNSGGNLVLLRSFASTPVAMAAVLFFHSGPSPVVVAGRVLVARMC